MDFFQSVSQTEDNFLKNIRNKKKEAYKNKI